MVDWDVKNENKQTKTYAKKEDSDGPVKICCVARVFTQGLHRLEKYLDIQDCLEKSLKIKYALTSTGKSHEDLEKSLIFSTFCRN